MDLKERLVRLPRTGDFGWLRDYGAPGDPPPRTRRRAPLFALFLCGEAGAGCGGPRHGAAADPHQGAP